ncbi:MAG: NADH-quinone oxidoreductase subunit H [Deltaproteobacteria bacterium]|nr:NADH-quinone oxidoreductase subunit H [Deltaproteobacteria bacterium]
MRAAVIASHVLAVLVLPILVLGLMNRTRALWTGRRGPPLLQPYFELARLVRKQSVYSVATTAVFRVGPLVVLATALVGGLLTPLFGVATFRFPYDFVVVAYLWGLGRALLMLSALDTASSFEGMGASREATYAALAEPVLFLTLGTLAMATGQTSFAGLLHVAVQTPGDVVVRAMSVAALLVILQVEAARSPVDDPATHLELTMIHEVMILDHSGPELAALHYGSAIKLTSCAALIATLLNPLAPSDGALRYAGANLVLVAVVAVLVGSIESLVARLRLKAVPQLILVAMGAALVSLLAGTWTGGAPG